MFLDDLSDDELVALYNATDPKPNQYGEELLRRIHARDREEFGMSAEALR